ncbi:PLP-dependent aminotransferase family protein [Sneathiella glossodoripedis]|uniref:MocR-like pyridoxine biosynthesis transcription factor PdxR n=1 Tax=Sneathiella glossodoripedis TaxID=418853 RepID=UPI000472145E|nr:PLP-dependent aminotransferase family protein [Sneathiella glossodoripedis]
MFIPIDRNAPVSLQEQLRTHFVAAIVTGKLASGTALPSSREIARKNGLSRTTVVLVYEKLVEDGFLIAKDRSGYFVADDFQAPPKENKTSSLRGSGGLDSVAAGEAVDWSARFALTPSTQRNITKPYDWQAYQYPFVYGQPDPSLFPLAAWRECSRQAMSELSMRSWANDAISQDDPALVEQIKSKLLPRRGIFADDSEILITAGAQNALFLLAYLLFGKKTCVAVEDPGYPDARNIFALHGAHLKALKLDQEGAIIGADCRDCDYLFVTPSCQSPTNVVMSAERQKKLLEFANSKDRIIIEDDFECDFNGLDGQSPALKAQDNGGRVIYLGSLSKSMFPGLRLGYIVASPTLISELRSLRRLMLRHVPSNNQRTTSLFIALGYHESYLRKLSRIYSERAEVMSDCIDTIFAKMDTMSNCINTSVWLQGPAKLDADQLAIKARDQGLLIEPGSPHFMKPEKNRNFMRLGFSSIATDQIRPGLELLARLMEEQLSGIN